MKSLAFKLAHQLFRTGRFTSFAVALRRAWLKIRVSFGRVSTVLFQKEDGAERLALIGRAPKSDEPKGERRDNPLVCTYFDAEKLAFRSFRLDRVIEMEF